MDTVVPEEVVEAAELGGREVVGVGVGARDKVEDDRLEEDLALRNSGGGVWRIRTGHRLE